MNYSSLILLTKVLVEPDFRNKQQRSGSCFLFAGISDADMEIIK